MVRSIVKFLGGEVGEEQVIFLLLAKGFFMGILLASYQIGSETLFLQMMGKEWLDVAFFTAGGLGVIGTVLYVMIQRIVKFSVLASATTIINLLFLGSLRYSFEFFSSGQEYEILCFILFVMIGPITSITILNFWGVFGRLFDAKQSKRIIGGIDTGQLLATMIAFFSIPLLTSTIIDKTYDLLLVSVLAAIGVAIVTVVIVFKYDLGKYTKAKEKNDPKPQFNFKSLVSNQYIRLMSVFIIFSMGAAVFVNYTFLSATEIMYPDERKLSDFLSIYNGTVIVVSFLIQSFINDFIIGKFGLKVALMTMPLILILFSVSAIAVGHAFEYQVKNDDYLFFFVLIGVGKLLTFSLKDALENPAFKMFFLPLDNRIRFDIQTVVEGVVNSLATLIAGAAQIGLGLLVFFKLIHYSYFVLGMAGLTVYLAFKLYDEYKKTLKETLAKQKSRISEGASRDVVNILKKSIKSFNEEEVTNSLKMLEKLYPIEFELILVHLLNHQSSNVRAYSYKKIAERQCWEYLPQIEKQVNQEKEDKILKIAQEVCAELREMKEIKLSETIIRQFVRSVDAKNRIKGARLLVEIKDLNFVPYIQELLRDLNPAVRKAAIITAGKSKRPEFWPAIIENLHNTEYTNYAISSLCFVKESAFLSLDAAFYRSGQYLSTMTSITQIISRVGGRTAVNLLWKKIDFPDKKVVAPILLALNNLGFVARGSQRATIKLNIEKQIGDIAWNVKTMLEIPQTHAFDKIIFNALMAQNKKHYDDLFMLLGMIYDRQSIALVKRNIESGTTDNITFAVEMLDVFIDEEMKSKVIPAVEETKVQDRLNKLHDEFPLENFEDYTDLLLQIVNRDYNRIDSFTKTMAINRVGMLATEVYPDLISNLFNPDDMLRQTAANAIYQIDKEAYYVHTARLNVAVKNELDGDILPPIFNATNEDNSFHRHMLYVERIILIRKIKLLSALSNDIITQIAKKCDEKVFKANHTLFKQGEVCAAHPIYFVVSGVIDTQDANGVSEKKSTGDILNFKNILSTDTFSKTAITRSDTTFLTLEKDELFYLMSQFSSLAECWLGILNEVSTQKNDSSVAEVLYKF